MRTFGIALVTVGLVLAVAACSDDDDTGGSSGSGGSSGATGGGAGSAGSSGGAAGEAGSAGAAGSSVCGLTCAGEVSCTSGFQGNLTVAENTCVASGALGTATLSCDNVISFVGASPATGTWSGSETNVSISWEGGDSETCTITPP